MFLKKINGNVTDYEFYNSVLPHEKRMNKFLSNIIIPEIVAYHIAIGYFKSCIFESSFDIMISNATYMFCDRVKASKQLKYKIKKILTSKYNLQVINEIPLQVKNINYNKKKRNASK